MGNPGAGDALEGFSQPGPAFIDDMRTRLPSRRDTLRLVAIGGPTLAAGAVATSILASSPPAPRSDREFLQGLADRGGGTVPRRVAPYRLSEPVRLPAGCVLTFEPGTVLLWNGPPHTGPRAPRGVLVAAGDDVTVGGPGVGVTIRAARPDPDLFGVLVAGQANATVQEVSTIDCAHLFATAGGAGGRQGCRNLVVRGGGASFARLPANPWQAACTVQYTDGFVVEGSRYRNVAHGVQWWGGDASPKVDGAWNRERLCRNGRVEQVTVEGAVGCSVWGSMGQAIRVIDCRGTNAGDVGFDAEGSIDVEFLRCSQQNAKRGCFSTFFFNRGIVFRDCVGVQPLSAQPLFRLYSEVPGGNRDVSILGGRFECLDREPGVIDDAYGDARSVTVRGAMLVNVTIILHHREHAQVVVEDNSLSFPGNAAASFDAIRVGVPVDFPGTVPLLRIVHNRITSSASAPVASGGIRVLRSPGQSTRSVSVFANIVTGFARAPDVP